MPDSRSHRGAHPEDARDFASEQLPALRAASEVLGLLLERAYAPDASLKLVGDHHQLTARQRKAVQRATSAPHAAQGRRERRVLGEQLAGASLVVDGFNALITVEAMLSRAPVFRGTDGALRDLASVHGTYRSVEETEQAALWMLEALAAMSLGALRIYFDRPVGNSGRTRALFADCCQRIGLAAEVTLSDHVDAELIGSGHVVASSDSVILDRAAAWLDLPAQVARAHQLDLWLLDFS